MADRALSLYPKVPCSTWVLQITLTYTGAATLRTGNQFSPSFSSWSFVVDNEDVCVMLLTDLRMQSIKRLKGMSSSSCRNLPFFFFCWSFIYLGWGGEWDCSNLYLLLFSHLKPKFKSQKVSSHSSLHSWRAYSSWPVNVAEWKYYSDWVKVSRTLLKWNTWDLWIWNAKTMNRNAVKCFLRLLVEPFLGGSRRVGNEGVKLGLEEGELGETCSQFFFCFSLSYFIF